MNRQELLQQLMENLQNLYRCMLDKSDYKKYGIPLGQKAALFTIAMHKTTNVKQLASFLHITSGAATQHVEGLVKEGLVERTLDPHDRRNVIIMLSAKGKSLIKKLDQNRNLMMKDLFSDITDDELLAYNNVMSKVINKINKVG